MHCNSEDIDLELEKLGFLLFAKEDNLGICELIWGLGYYDLNLEDKYKIAHQLLNALLVDELIVLEKYADSTLQNLIETFSLEKTEEILNSPFSWYPDIEIITISITEKGDKYLETNIPKLGKSYDDRFGLVKM
jgi:hypothetical protein